MKTNANLKCGLTVCRMVHIDILLGTVRKPVCDFLTKKEGVWSRVINTVKDQLCSPDANFLFLKVKILSMLYAKPGKS